VVRPGGAIAVESPAYYGTLQTLEALGLKVVEVPCQPETGMDLDELERRVDRHRAKAAGGAELRTRWAAACPTPPRSGS
jgi:DNA-binding transcriptional MocR family regulator